MRSKILSLKMKDQSQTLFEARLEWEHPQSGEKAEKKKLLSTCCLGSQLYKNCVCRREWRMRLCGKDVKHIESLQSLPLCGWLTLHFREQQTVVSVKLNHVKVAIVSPNCWLHMVESSTHTHQSNSSVSKCIAKRHFYIYAQDIFVVSK